MKKLSLVVFSLCFITFHLMGQDIIITNDGKKIESKIIEITTETIKYREHDFLDGPLRNILISEVIMVVYENGSRELFTSPEVEAKEEATNETEASTYKGTHFMLGAGFGNSYGFIGVRVQYRHAIGLYQGIGFHAGVGFSPEFPVLVSGGVKYFPYKWLYANVQFGILGEEDIYWDGEYHHTPILYGPSFLVGGDFEWGRKIGYGFNVGIGGSYVINASQSIGVAMDMGFVIRF